MRSRLFRLPLLATVLNGVGFGAPRGRQASEGLLAAVLGVLEGGELETSRGMPPYSCQASEDHQLKCPLLSGRGQFFHQVAVGARAGGCSPACRLEVRLTLDLAVRFLP